MLMCSNEAKLIRKNQTINSKFLLADSWQHIFSAKNCQRISLSKGLTVFVDFTMFNAISSMERYPLVSTF